MATATNSILVSPGVRLHYSQAGPPAAPNLVLIPGWSQTAAQFQKQVAHFQTRYRVTTYDHRGHGDSDKPGFGYRVYRLAADLEALLEALELRDVVVLGHSMGVSVVWAYWDLFPPTRIRKLVLVDQSPAMTINPSWTAEQKAEAAAMFEPAQVFEASNAMMVGPQGEEAREALSRSFYTEKVSEEDFEWSMRQARKMPPDLAGRLMLDHAAMDWRDVIPRITVPTLVVGAKGSPIPITGIEWIAKQIPGSRLEIFEKEEGGSHCMFWENPEKFNRILEEFLAS
ncbi:alpha/beta-hydrolase [Hypoxylon fragiforme]|uniref:alpha/beta-hydrolase n=1 Tax=Hypoxylon fragiforme TaxID=63214 RepID=UPI0020C6FA71|nr:alpha/beta-hydrolase [Hypoxylon fragiforme]KAI2605475.1 alpha/beta-hydrolase [Hypoxylon fragiforme]